MYHVIRWSMIWYDYGFLFILFVLMIENAWHASYAIDGQYTFQPDASAIVLHFITIIISVIIGIQNSTNEEMMNYITFFTMKPILITIQTLIVQTNSAFTDFRYSYEYIFIKKILEMIFITIYVITLWVVTIYVKNELIWLLLFLHLLSLIASGRYRECMTMALTVICMILIIVCFAVLWYTIVGISVIPITISLYTSYINLSISETDSINTYIITNRQREGDDFINTIVADISNLV